MQLVFEKVEVVNLEADLRKIGLSIDELNLQLDELGSCQAYFTPKQTWLAKNFNKRRDQRLWDLCKNDALYLAKQVKDTSKARVRVVNALPKHLSAENKDNVFISVWLKR